MNKKYMYNNYGCREKDKVIERKKWSEIPYPGQEAPYKGIERDAGCWGMNYFKYLGNDMFNDNKGKRIIWQIENPKNIDFVKELKEVEYIQNSVNEEEIAMAKYWGRNVPVATILPIAMELIIAYKINPPRSARIISVLSKTINDAFIITWYFKYLFNYARPIQLNNDLNTVLETPKFPTYPSGHSVVSAAAAEVMAYYFESEKSKIMQIAEEASISRLYGGIHFRSDLSEGLNLGKQIGKAIIKEISNERDKRGMIIDSPITEFRNVDIIPKYL